MSTTASGSSIKRFDFSRVEGSVSQKANIRYAITPESAPANLLKRAQRLRDQLEEQGEPEEAEIVDRLLRQWQASTIPALDLMTTTEAGNLIGVTGQTIKNWVKNGSFQGYRVGNRIMIPREAVEEYVRRARTSLDLEEISDEEASELVREGRRR